MRKAATLLVLLVTSSLISTTARAQAVIKVNDDVNIKFGILLQGWADWTQDPVTEGYAQNLFLRRARLLMGGQIAPKVSFFVDTDSPNLGRVVSGAKTTGGFILQDAIIEYKFADELILAGGLMLSPLSRNGQQSAGGHLTIDYGTYSFLASGPTQSVVGRDTGFVLKGYLLAKHLEYRVGAFQGQRDAASRNALRSTGRLQYEVLDTEQALFYPGTYLGKKKVLALGIGYDVQRDYFAYSGDVFFDHPVGPGAITAQAEFIHYDGGTTLTTLPKEDTFLGEVGYYITKAKVTPWLRYESKAFSAVAKQTGDEKRYQAGLSYFLRGQNFSIKAGYGRVEPNVGNSTNVFTVQLQAFYY
jgi:hypothetical protein